MYKYFPVWCKIDLNHVMKFEQNVAAVNFQLLSRGGICTYHAAYLSFQTSMHGAQVCLFACVSKDRFTKYGPLFFTHLINLRLATPM